MTHPCSCRHDHPLETPRLDTVFLDALLARVADRPDGLLDILHALQDEYRHLPPAALRYLGEHSPWSYGHILSVATFYDQFRLTPAGQHTICVCTGTTCHVKGAPAIYDSFQRYLHISPDADTDAEGQFTLRKVACLGCCTLAPAITIDAITFGHVTPDTVPAVIQSFLQTLRSATAASAVEAAAQEVPLEIRIGLDSCCCARGCDKVFHAFAQAIAQQQFPAVLKPVGCVGLCAQTPMVEFARTDQPSMVYFQVRPEDAEALLRRHCPPLPPFKRLAQRLRQAADDLLIGAAAAPLPSITSSSTAGPLASFERRQTRIATEHFACDNPDDLAAYQRRGGFTIWRQCRQQADPEALITQIAASGLRGRGGAGFPTAEKWRSVARQSDTEKYVICNADEGDPGAFMDRMLLESFPYRVIEGLAIAAYAVGASRGYFYIRHEYPLAYQRICHALEQCRRAGLIGAPAGSHGIFLDIRVVQGAGAFVCGEETALIASLESQRPFPRLRPPYPAQAGLWGHPTLVNNVETLAMIPWILRRSPDAFRKYGVADSRGTKVFCLVGKVNQPSLIEVPMGISLREVVFDIGGGIPNNKAFKAVQIGGPSGACLPAALSDTPLDYSSLQELDAIMGSGGIVVLDEDDCMVELALYFLAFTRDQSCGKCSFCRIGTYQLHNILQRICQGKGHGVWQRHYWEHLIRDEVDYQRHVNYVHVNPLKHGYVKCVEDWSYSTFQQYVTQGIYLPNWCGDIDISVSGGE